MRTFKKILAVVLFIAFFVAILIVTGGDNLSSDPNPVMDWLSFWIGPLFAYIVGFGVIALLGYAFIQVMKSLGYTNNCEE